MMECAFRLSLAELLTRPAVELRLVGAEGNDNDADGTDDDDLNDDGNDGDEDDDDGEDKSKTGGAEPDAKDRLILRLKDDKTKIFKRLRTAEGERDTAVAEVAQLKKDGTTDQTTKDLVTSQASEIEKLKTVNGDLALELAFLKSNTYTWHNPATALRLADLSKVELDDETGEVHGLDDALKALAEANPYLIAKDKDEDDEDDKKPKPRRTGDSPKGKGGDDKSAQAAKSKLQSKYPGLRR